MSSATRQSSNPTIVSRNFWWLSPASTTSECNFHTFSAHGKRMNIIPHYPVINRVHRVDQGLTFDTAKG